MNKQSMKPNQICVVNKTIHDSQLGMWIVDNLTESVHDIVA